MPRVSEIKLIRTDTTLDLSQKAEKVCWVSVAIWAITPAQKKAGIQTCDFPVPRTVPRTRASLMPPPPLSRLVRELSHVSVDYFVPRPGTALSASQDASQTLRPRHAPDMRLRSRSRSHRCAGRGVALFPLAHARRPLAGSAPRLECGDDPNLNQKLNPKP